MTGTHEYDELIKKYLEQTRSVLVNYLNNILPNISNNWWEKTVIEKLTDDQRRMIRRKEIVNLAGLDLAALLRIFDMNWNEISQQNDLIYEDRNILKETQAVRNRWSHIPEDGYLLKDIYRDFDTIQRFLEIINADQKIIDEIIKIELDIIQKINNVSTTEPTKDMPPVIIIPGNKVYSDYWFVNTGIGRDRLRVRRWEYNINYDFISAGDGVPFLPNIRKLQQGYKIFAYISGYGYVGFGEVEAEAISASEFFKKIPNDNPWKDYPDADELIVKVKWGKTFNENEAVPNNDNPFPYMNNVCRLRVETLEYLKAEFGKKRE